MFTQKVQHKYWVKKERDVVEMNWNSLVAISRLEEHDNLKVIAIASKKHFEVECLLNPFIWLIKLF